MTVQTSIVYSGAGDSGPFAVPFAYLSKAHIQVTVDDVAVAFTWPTDSAIQLGAPAAMGAVIEIRRITPRDVRLVDFTDGSVLTEADLDLAILQQLYIAQETAEEADKTIRTVADGNFDAQSKRIVNVATPTADTDAATKGYADTVSGAASATAAAASASAAAASAAAAAQSAADAQGGGVGVTDGDKGDVTVSGSGATWTLDAVVTTAKAPSGSKTGSDARFVTGTAGASNTAAMWNADGDAVAITAAGGDAIPVSAPSGSGNLAASVDSLGELVSAVDALSTSSVSVFTSSAITGWSNGSLQTIAHGLGAAPRLEHISVFAEATTAEHNWAIGETASVQTGVNASDQGIVVSVDATNIYLRIGNSGVTIADKTSFLGRVLTPSSWSLRVTASIGAGAVAVGGMTDLLDDTTPQLGGDLDTNGYNIIIDGSHGIDDELGNEVLRISRDSAAVNYLQIVTGNTGFAPKIDAVGDDTDIGLQLRTKGTGQVFINDDRALTTADEGTGNGLDADTVDGMEASAFAAASHTHSASEITIGAVAIANGGTGATTAADARTALGVDAAGTDNSTDVTLAGAYDYLSLTGQEITLGQIDLVTDVTGALPRANGGLGVALSDPNADRLLFWDDSAGAYAFLSVGSNLSISGTTLNASTGGGGTSVTLAGAYDYLTLSGQEITLGQIDLTTDVTGALTIANGGTGATTAAAARTALGVDAAGTDNSTDVTLAGSYDYLTLSGQEITLGQIDLTTDVAGALPISNGGTGATTAAGIRSAINVADGATANSAASAAEINTGTNTAKFVTPDALAGSHLGERGVLIEVVEAATDVATGDGQAYVTVPSFMAGMNLVAARADVVTAGTTGSTTVQVRNVTQAADMLSGVISISSGATASSSVTIDSANDDVAAGDRLRIDVDSVSTTAPQGLTVTLEFRLP